MHRIIFALTFGIALILAFATAEFAARLWLNSHTFQPQPSDLPNPFIRVKTHMEDYGLSLDDYSDPQFSVIAGARTVTDQPRSYAQTVWIFGNSGTFDPYVPDRQTAASIVQRMLTAYGYHWRVANLALPALYASGEYRRLQDTAVQPGDTVLFIDSVMDKVDAIKTCPFARFSSLALYQILCQTPVPHFDGNKLDRYWQVIDLARAYSSKRGASFVHLIQACVQDQSIMARSERILKAPDSDFLLDYAERCHLTPQGDVVIAPQLFDAITSF